MMRKKDYEDEGMAMLKKLFGKKKQNEHEMNGWRNESMMKPPMNDFYHHGLPPSLMGKSQNQMFPPIANGEQTRMMPYFLNPMAPPQNMPQSMREVLPHMPVLNQNRMCSHELPNHDEQSHMILPEQMMLYQHTNLQKKLQSPDFPSPAIMNELNNSRQPEMENQENDEKRKEGASRVNGFELRLRELEGKEIYGVRVNGKNYGYHFGFHDPKCEIPAYQKEKVQMNHVKIGKMSGRVVALHVWCEAKDGEPQQTETIYVRLEKIDALILYASQALNEVEAEKEWKSELISDQKENSFKLHTLNETYLLKEIQCDSDIFGQIRVDYKMTGMGTDDVILDYVFRQRKSGEKASIQQERLKIYIPIDKVVSIETK